MFRTTGLVILALLSAAPAWAAEPQTGGTAAEAADSPLAADTDWALKPMHIGSNHVSRGALLPAMYVSLAALNVYDAYSTRRGILQGAVETNTAVRAVAGQPVALLAAKAGSTAVSIYFAERLWRRHRRAEAIAVMVVSNGIMAVVAARNASVLYQTR